MANNFFRKAGKSILITANVFVSILLLLSFYGTKTPLGNHWFFNLLNLASFYFFAILIFFFFLFLFIKPILTMISIITIAICWMPLQHVFQWRFESFNYKKERDNIRVMSWNVEHFVILEHKTHPEKKTEMIEVINSFHPDIACFQEMVANDTTRNAINYIPDFQKKMGIKNYYYAYDKKLDFDRNHHFGIITFSKLPIVNHKTITVEKSNYNAIYQYVDVVKNADTFRVFNVHLQSLRFSPTNKMYIEDPSLTDDASYYQTKSVIKKLKIGFIKRKQQIENIKSEIDKSPYPVILCGDFNDLPNSYAYNLIGESLNNTFRSTGSGIGNTFSGILPTLRIDNIFVDKKFEINQFIRVKKKLSDHYPIVSDIKLNHK
jgi:endonuclease/exonuclease/phosphatase family metal-dependent hydrolase